MSLDLTIQEIDEIWMEAEQHCPPAVSIDRLETIHPIPSRLGSGYLREMELCSGMELCIFSGIYDDLKYRVEENLHPIQFTVHLSGVVDSGDFLYQDANHSYVGGSGIQRTLTVFHPASQAEVGVDIHIQPHLLRQFFATPTGELPAELQVLVQEEDWQRVFSTRTTGAMRSVVQQMIDCPYMGVSKRLYLQGKVFELMALQLDSVLAGDSRESSRESQGTILKPDTVGRIHQAAEILRSRLEQPPAQAELARLVGVAYCTLHKGFRSVFGVTPFGYLTQQRMQRAERLLRQPDCTVAEAANLVGYTNPAQFAAAFRRQFGISPRDCMRGKKCGAKNQGAE
jgi:AraC-like DNA-binding protein